MESNRGLSNSNSTSSSISNSSKNGRARGSRGGGSRCTLVLSYDRLANGNQGPDPPGPHGARDAAFTMRVTMTGGGDIYGGWEAWRRGVTDG